MEDTIQNPISEWNETAKTRRRDLLKFMPSLRGRLSGLYSEKMAMKNIQTTILSLQLGNWISTGNLILAGHNVPTWQKKHYLQVENVFAPPPKKNK